MKKMLAYGLAAVLSIATVAATADTAAAGHWHGGVWFGGPGPWYGPNFYPGQYAYYPQTYYYYQPYYYDPGPAFVASIFGSILGSFPRAPAPRRLYVGGNAHMSWCLSRYRTYNPTTNLYVARLGVYRACNSPYG